MKQCQEDQLACLGDIEDLIASLSSVLVGGMVALRAWGELWVYFKSENRASEDTGDGNNVKFQESRCHIPCLRLFRGRGPPALIKTNVKEIAITIFVLIST